MYVLSPALASGVRGETRDLSSGGVSFKAQVPALDPGDAIEYVITLLASGRRRNAVQLRCVGKILRNDGASSVAATLERYEFVRQPGA